MLVAALLPPVFPGKVRTVPVRVAPLPTIMPGAPVIASGITVPWAAEPVSLNFQRWVTDWAWEDAISAAENKVTTLEATLQDPAVFKERGAEVQSLVAELDAARAEVERLFTRWQELDAIPKE